MACSPSAVCHVSSTQCCALKTSGTLAFNFLASHFWCGKLSVLIQRWKRHGNTESDQCYCICAGMLKSAMTSRWTCMLCMLMRLCPAWRMPLLTCRGSNVSCQTIYVFQHNCLLTWVLVLGCCKPCCNATKLRATLMVLIICCIHIWPGDLLL